MTKAVAVRPQGQRRALRLGDPAPKPVAHAARAAVLGALVLVGTALFAADFNAVDDGALPALPTHVQESQ